MSRVVKILALSGAVLFLLLSCSRQIPETVSPLPNDDVPPTPGSLTATMSDRTIYLTWVVGDTQVVQFYRVYRSDSIDTDYKLMAEVTRPSYTSINLLNGQTYFFRVSSVSLAGFEGYRSLEVRAIPNLYGVIINGGDEYTNNRDVTLTTVAPMGTTYMQVSNDSSFGGSFWENYAPGKSWQLEAGDRLKTVYIKYRDQVDQATARTVSGSITLDTQANIDSLNFTPSGQAFVTGDQIHFKLFAGESEGNAQVTVGEGLVRVELYDDGSRGDAVANDGIYEGDFSIPGNLEFRDASVFGNFTDRASNAAERAQANDDMSVRCAPEPVNIYSINAPTGYFDRLELSWNSSAINDFAQYRIYRSQAASVDSSDFLTRVINSSGVTTLVDTGLTENSIYYYKVFVVDDNGLSTGSNEVHTTTNSNSMPDPVVLYPAIASPGTYDRLNLSWSASDDQDFLRYELYRSYDNLVDNLDILILVSATQVAVIDSNLAPDSTYYYRVRVLDRAGHTSWSNTVNGQTGLDLPPEAATFYPLVTEPDHYQDIRMQWIQPYISDFQYYRLYSWRANRSDSTLVAIITLQDSLAFTDHPQFGPGADTISYNYLLYTCDRGGNCTPSNILNVRLIDNAPPQVSGTVIADSSALSISWSATEIPDFTSYRLTRDTVSTPDQGILVYMSDNQSTTTYRDSNIARGHTYYYWLSVYDRRGHSTRSFLGSSRW